MNKHEQATQTCELDSYLRMSEGAVAAEIAQLEESGDDQIEFYLSHRLEEVMEVVADEDKKVEVEMTDSQDVLGGSLSSLPGIRLDDLKWGTYYDADQLAREGIIVVFTSTEYDQTSQERKKVAVPLSRIESIVPVHEPEV